MRDEDNIARLHGLVTETMQLRQAVVDQLGTKIIDTAARISAVFATTGKLLIAGNGGSMSDASHFAAELVVRLTGDEKRQRQALPAIALGVDPCVMTAAGNDFGYERTIERQVEALGTDVDMLFVISTSGNSKNLLRAVDTAIRANIQTVALLGGNGGKLAKMAQHSLIVPHNSTQRIQEEHIFIIHELVWLVENHLLSCLTYPEQN